MWFDFLILPTPTHSRLISNEHKCGDFSLPFVRVNKNMKILCLHLSLPSFNDDSPIQISLFVCLSISLSSSSGDGSEEILLFQRICIHRIFLFRLILSALPHPSQEKHKIFYGIWFREFFLSFSFHAGMNEWNQRSKKYVQFQIAIKVLFTTNH